MGKRFIGVDVLTAARSRVAWTFDNFNHVCVSFSGGKDSTVLLHLTMDEAMRRGRKVAVLFVDWEAQYKLTIDHVAAMFDEYKAHMEPYWVALPLTTVNAVSQFEPEWICWDPTKRDAWVREAPAQAITDPAFFPFYKHAMTFEEFVPAFGKWLGRDGTMTAIMVGIRTAESLNRFRTIARGFAGGKTTFDDKAFTTWFGGGVYNVYPIYDWTAQDDWTYSGKFGKPYNKIYDLMHKAGLSVHQMRIDEPFGPEQRRGLQLFATLEPETWGRMVARVNGANMGALYSDEAGSVLGNIRINKPDNRTWKQFVELLLGTMPAKTAEHYRNKVAVYLHWYESRGYPSGIPDEQDNDCQQKDNTPSWRRICKVILRNDYWCKGLSFSPTKAGYYERYLKVMKNRRREWGIW